MTSQTWIDQLIFKTQTESASPSVPEPFRGKRVLTSDISQYTIPLYPFDSATPRVSVKLSGYFSEYDVDDYTRKSPGFAPTVPNVPLPRNADGGVGTDGQIVIWDAKSGVEWGFWQFKREVVNGVETFTASNGYRYHTGKGFNGRFGNGLSGRGAATTYMAGLVRPWEIRRGRIDHALAMAYHGPGFDCLYPAAKSDGQAAFGSTARDVPEGTRVQLNPQLDLSTLGLSPAGLAMARALQEYGAYIIDNSGSTKVYVEDTVTAHWPTDPSDPMYVGRHTVSGIPLDQLRVVTPPGDPRPEETKRHCKGFTVAEAP